jgi:hypothetical protein
MKAHLCSYLGHPLILSHTPRSTIWGWDEGSFTLVVIVCKKGLAHDITSLLVMVITLTLVRSITTPGCPVILHAALLGLRRYPL